MVSAIMLLTTVAWFLLTAAGQQHLTDGGCAALVDRMEALENFARQQVLLNKGYTDLAGKMETQARLIDDLVAEKEKWQKDKIDLLAENLSLRQDMASLRLTVIHLEALFSTQEANFAVDAIVNENDAEGHPPKLTKETSVTETHKPAIFVRSDDTDPMVPVLTQLTARINQIGASLQALTNEVNEGLPEASTSVFVNWGSSICPGSAELVYTGTVGGSNFNDTGSAVNYLCLPLNQIVLSNYTGTGSAFLYGGEYKDGDNLDKDPVCAVCRSSRATNVMIPATTVCPAGWTSEYSGWLMAGYPDQSAASEFICVNFKKEERQGSEERHNGKLLYYTATRCGSLPCPPFVNDRLVTCVVCSK